jgi:hypothetical protein
MDIVEGSKDHELLTSALSVHSHREEISNRAELTELRRLLGVSLSGAEQALFAECVAYFDSGIAVRAVPALFALRDDDGLTALDALKEIAPGIYRAGDNGELAIFAHHCLRRSLSPLNGLNGQFLRELHAPDVRATRPRIALDPDVVGLASSFKNHFEFEYWWGPKFNDSLAEIPTGVTRHEATEVQRLYTGVSATEFWWQSRKGEHIFEVEELRDSETRSPTHPPFGCRYVHSIVSEATGSTFHLDGAVRFYSESEMMERLGASIAQTGRDKVYVKLWRIDGSISTPVWKRLLSDYFRDNMLVGEYLGGSEIEKASIGSEAVLPVATPDSSSIASPSCIGASIGIRSLLAVIKKPDVGVGRTVLSSGTFGTDSAKASTQFVEHDIVGFTKELERAGESIECDRQYAHVAVEDRFHRLPLVWHSDQSYLRGSLVAGAELAKMMAGVGDGHALAMTFGIPVEGEGSGEATESSTTTEVGLLISVSGEAADVATLLDDWSRRLPSVTANPSRQIASFANAIALSLEAWPTGRACVDDLDFAATTGDLRWQRETLGPEEWCADSVGEQVSLTLSDERRSRMAKRLESEPLVPVPVMIILRSHCSECEQNYEQCAHSTFRDLQCTEIIDEARCIALSLTSRPA